MSKHIIECLGKSKVTVEDGKVTEVTEPEVKYCPLFDHHRNIKELTKEAVKENVQFRIDDFGMCTENRELKMKDYLNFGISEIISSLLDEGRIDCAVMVCEGCGTVLVKEAELAQGVGGRVSGLVETETIPEVVENIGAENVLSSEIAEVNQTKGIEKAIEDGCKDIVVTVALASDIPEINKLKEDNPYANIYVFAVHTTGLSKEEARTVYDGCDIVTSCASKHIREIGDKESIKTVGQSIPIYASTEKGKEFIEIRLKKIGGETPAKENPDLPYPLI